jgi:hypothetical protein
LRAAVYWYADFSISSHAGYRNAVIGHLASLAPHGIDPKPRLFIAFGVGVPS